MISDIIWLKRMLSHNVRMPMSVITGYGKLLQQGLLSAEEERTAIQNICNNITYMDEVLRVVLEDSMDDDDTPALEIVDVAKLLRRATEYVSEVAKKMSLEISVRTEESQMLIRAELIPMMQVFYQLFENAIKYLECGNLISINAYYVEEAHVLIVFKDNGKGMNEKEAKRIFEEGFRGSNSLGKSGSGYGLFDVKQTVERYGGTVAVSSRKQKGFSVFLMFPVYRESSREGGVRKDGVHFAG